MILINFKICDNAKECYALEKCPTGAIYWNESENSLGINQDRCNSCGICTKSCEVNAIKVAKTTEEFNSIKDEFGKDPRIRNDLYIDRYGAMPIHPAFQLRESWDRFEMEILKSKKRVVLEIYDDDSIRCLLYSVPIKQLLNGRDVKYRKLNLIDKKLRNRILCKYEINQLPSFLVFEKGKMIAKHEGYFSLDDKNKLEIHI